MDLDDVDNTEEFRCISLCSGYAGIELGLEKVIPNLRTVLYVEVEAFACTNLVAKIEEGKLDAAPIWTDIKTFNGRPFRDRIHLIIGGYPCQPFSVAGKRQGTDDLRHLWPHIERIIETVRPIWCFFENVSGHLTLGFPKVYRSLRNLGYTVEAGLFTAAECGIGFEGERLFILATSYANRLEIYRHSEGCGKIHKNTPNKDNNIASIKRFWQTASRTYRGINGTPNRMDRLRLLGNGVVPQCAEKAFITLMALFKKG